MQQSIQQITYKTIKYAYVRAELTPMESTYHLYIIKVNDILGSRRQEENQNFYIVLQVSLNGYGTKMIALALVECKKLSINKVLMVCDKDNIASAKTIINNGGVLENEFVDENGRVNQRYWIEIK